MRKALKLATLSGLALAAGLALNTGTSTKAAAASCWNHNGSVMRLEASGNQRWFYYQNPRQAMRTATRRTAILGFWQPPIWASLCALSPRPWRLGVANGL